MVKTSLEEEIRNLSEGKDDLVFTIPLSDLVMVQMVGNLGDMLNSLSTNINQEQQKPSEKVEEKISETRKAATTYKLFQSIVQKTIEAQFGDKHAALRELGQNAIDSYDLSDTERPVIFDLESNTSHLILRARDFGCGMSIQTLVRDLLIPYNSAKEFDPNKIGEHGIGWYSVVDLADFVKVISRTKENNHAVQALVYKEKEDWKATIQPFSENGFTSKLNMKPNGTEVIAFIPKKTIRQEQIKDFLFQYLGYVDETNAQIIFEDNIINSLGRNYIQASPIDITIDGCASHLKIGVSKREINGTLSDHRFRHRNQNLEKIVYTQNGLFIKYDSPPFDEKTIHGKLFKDMLRMGLDFWVEIPNRVTLTKGRNNIIADHWPAVLDGMYKAFENVFLDVLLGDEEILYHPSDTLIRSIANLFDKHYSPIALAKEENKFSNKIKFLSKTSSIGSKIIDSIYLLGENSARASKNIITKTPITLKKAGIAIKEKLPEIGKQVLDSSKKWSLRLGPAGGLGYGAIKLYENYGAKPFIYILEGIGVAAGAAALGALGYKIHDSWPDIKEKFGELFSKDSSLSKSLSEALSEPITLEDILNGFKKFGSGMKRVMTTPINLDSELLSHIASGIKNAGRHLVHKLGLYVDIEEKRERKREKQRKKITRKYLSEIQRDAFFKRIMNKEIIPAQYYWSLHKEEKESNQYSEDKTLGENSELWGRLLPDDISNYQNLLLKRRRFFNVSPSDKKLEKKDVKLSIDKLIDLHLKGKLKHNKGLGISQNIEHDTFFVDYMNPLVHTIIDKLERISYEVRDRYDVKVLEDHLDNILRCGKELAGFAYTCSGLFILPLIINGLTKGKIKDPLENTGMYKLAIDIGKAFKEAGVKNAGRVSLKTLEKIAFLPYYASKYALKGGVKIGQYTLHKMVQTGKKINPARYPEYVKHIKNGIEGRIENIAENHRARIEVRKAKLEKRAQFLKEEKEREEQLRKEGLIKEQSIWSKLGERLKDIYQKTAIYSLVGYGMTEGNTFDNLDQKKLSHLVKTVGAGQTYLQFLQGINQLDSIVSKALGMCPLEPIYSYGVVDFYGDDGVGADKKSKLRLDLQSHSVSDFVKNSEERCTDDDMKGKFDYRILDLILHQKAHQAEGKFEHGSNFFGRHENGIYEKKNELRRQFMNYLLQENIDFQERMNQYFPQIESTENNHFNYISPTELSKMVRMTKRRLREERINYALKKQEHSEKK